jgi:hypothetical protein
MAIFSSLGRERKPQFFGGVRKPSANLCRGKTLIQLTNWHRSKIYQSGGHKAKSSYFKLINVICRRASSVLTWTRRAINMMDTVAFTASGRV